MQICRWFHFHFSAVVFEGIPLNFTCLSLGRPSLQLRHKSFVCFIFSVYNSYESEGRRKEERIVVYRVGEARERERVAERGEKGRKKDRQRVGRERGVVIGCMGEARERERVGERGREKEKDRWRGERESNYNMSLYPCCGLCCSMFALAHCRCTMKTPVTQYPTHCPLLCVYRA